MKGAGRVLLDGNASDGGEKEATAPTTSDGFLKNKKAEALARQYSFTLSLNSLH
jgi:hypothetical protein